MKILSAISQASLAQSFHYFSIPISMNANVFPNKICLISVYGLTLGRNLVT